MSWRSSPFPLLCCQGNGLRHRIDPRSRTMGVSRSPGGTEIGLELRQAVARNQDALLLPTGEDVSGHAPVAFARDFSIPSVSDPPTRTGVGRPSWRTASTNRPTDEYPAESRKDTSVNRTRPKAVWKALQLSQPVIPGSGPANLPMSICLESGRSLPARQAFIRFRDDLVRVCTGRPPVRTP